MNTYKIVGTVNHHPIAAQHVTALSAREAARLHREDYSNVEITEVWLLQPIAPEFWMTAPPVAIDEIADADLPKSRVVEIPDYVLADGGSSEMLKSTAARWAEMHGRYHGHTKWHAIFTDGVVTHYQFD
jgi:hypothetical protein